MKKWIKTFNVVNLAAFGALSYASYNGDKVASVVLGVFAAFWFCLYLLTDSLVENYKKICDTYSMLCSAWEKRDKERNQSWKI